MLQPNLLVRIAGPTVLVSLLLLGLSIAAAFYLYKEQAESAKEVGENVNSVGIAHELGTTLDQQISTLRNGSEPSTDQNEKVLTGLSRARAFADKEQERSLVAS